MRYEPALAGVRGHAEPARDSKLKSRAFDTMTGGAVHSFLLLGESRPGLGLRRPARTRPTLYGRTGRNVSERPTPGSSAEAGRLPVVVLEPKIDLNRDDEFIGASDSEFRRFQYHGCSLSSGSIAEPRR